MNESETCGPGGTNLTRPDSLDVHGIRSQLDAMRAKHGADSAIGHGASNIIEIFDSIPIPGPEHRIEYLMPAWAIEQRATLLENAKHQMARLARLTASAPHAEER